VEDIQIIRDLAQELLGTTIENDLQFLNSILKEDTKIIKTIQNQDTGKTRSFMEKHIQYIEWILQKRSIIKNINSSKGRSNAN
jgi:hypothetical protein